MARSGGSTPAKSNPEVERVLSESIDIVREMLAESKQSQPSQRNRFFWPAGLLHVLNIFQDAFAGRPDQIPLDLRSALSAAVWSAYRSPDPVDRKWALEVAGVLSETELTPMLRSGFSEEIQGLRDVTFAQAARLTTAPIQIITSIRRTLAARGVAWVLQRDKWTTLAYVQRLKHPGLKRTATLLLNIRAVDLLMHASLISFASWRLVAVHDKHARASIGLTLFSITITAIYAGVSRWGTFNRSSDDTPPPSLFLTSLFYLTLLRWTALFAAMAVLKIPLSPLAAYIVASWAPLSYWIATDNTASQNVLILWTVAPVAPLVKVLLHPIEAVESLRRRLKKNYKVIVAFIALSAALVSLVRLLTHIKYQRSVTLIEVAIVLSVLTAQLVWALIDVSRLKSWVKGSESEITPEALLTSLSTFRYSYFKCKLLSRITQNKALLERLLDNPSAESVLHAFVIQIQLDRSASKAFYESQRKSSTPFRRFDITTVRQDATGSPVFDSWYQQHCARKKSGLSHWSPEVLNELTRLLEISRLRPRKTDSHALASYSGAA